MGIFEKKPEKRSYDELRHILHDWFNKTENIFLEPKMWNYHLTLNSENNFKKLNYPCTNEFIGKVNLNYCGYNNVNEKIKNFSFPISLYITAIEDENIAIEYIETNTVKLTTELDCLGENTLSARIDVRLHCSIEFFVNIIDKLERNFPINSWIEICFKTKPADPDENSEVNSDARKRVETKSIVSVSVAIYRGYENSLSIA